MWSEPDDPCVCDHQQVRLETSEPEGWSHSKPRAYISAPDGGRAVANCLTATITMYDRGPGPRLIRRGEMASIRSTIVSHTSTRSCSPRCPMSIDRASSYVSLTSLAASDTAGHRSFGFDPLLSSFLTIESSFVSPLLVEGSTFWGLVASTFDAQRKRSCGWSMASAESCSANRRPPRARWCFAKACELGLEGIVSKRAGSFYRSGRSGSWLKTVNPDFVRRDACLAAAR